MSVNVGQLMSRDVVKVRPDMSLAEVDQILSANGVSGAPVVDEDLRVIGILSQTDIVRTIHEELSGASFYSSGDYAANLDLGDRLRQTRVRDVMQNQVHFVHVDHDISDAAGLMRRQGIHRVVVVDPDRRLVGILSSLDLMQVIDDIDLFFNYYGTRNAS